MILDNLALNRWNRFGTSIFSSMTQMAQAHNAINLAQGFPNFDGPDDIKQAACDAIWNGRNQYAPAIGIPELRVALAKRMQLQSGISFDPDRETTIFSGATEALFVAMTGLLSAGDEMITFAPFYDSYHAASVAVGAEMKILPLRPGDWSFDPQDLRKLITKKTKLILVNTPHNPTGKVFSESELGTIAAIAVEHDLLVISDEVYEEIIFDDAKHLHLANFPGMAERCITISSTSKTYSMTGWKIGYAFASAPLTQILRAVHQFTVFCSATPLQVGMVAAANLADRYYETLRAEYRERRDLLVDVLNSAGLRAQAPRGTYFVLADYSGVSDLPSLEFAHWLCREHGVAAIPLAPFYGGLSPDALSIPYLRFAFCKDLQTLTEAGQRLKQVRPPNLPRLDTTRGAPRHDFDRPS